MHKRQLGASGPQVSAIGVGCWSFAGAYGPTTEAESHDTLAAALDLGIDFLDTANVYGAGVSERVIGSFIKDHPNRFTIATKAAITRRDGLRVFDNSLEHLEAELDASLARLGTEHVDLFYVHRREPARPIEEVAGSLARLIEKGKIRAFGFSEIAPSSLRRASAEHHVAAVQSEYSLSTRSPELGLEQTCAELGTTLVAFSPIGRSLLTDTPFGPDKIAEVGFLKNNERFQEPNFGANIAQTDQFRALAADMGIPAAGLAIAWLIAKGDHVLPIPGTKSVAHLAELLEGAARSLTAEDLARIDAVLPVGWCHGDRYNKDQWIGPERYC